MVRPFTAESGYSMTEVLISTALGTIVLAGVFALYVSSSNSILGQTNQVQMQTEAKAAMDYMTKDLRMIYIYPGPPASPTISLTGDTISFTRIEESGFSSGGNNTTNPGTLNDSSKSWKVNAFASGAYSVKIISGTGSGPTTYPILSNTAARLTLSGTGWPSLAATPDTTSLYYIIRNKAFRRQADNTLRYQIGAGPFNLLAANMLPPSPPGTPIFSQPDSQSVTITLTARTQTKDPRTGQYASYTLSDTVRKRN